MSINTDDKENDGVRVVELDTIETASPENLLCKFTSFISEDDQALTDQAMTKREEFSESVSLSSISTEYSSTSSADLEEHRYLSQSLTSLSCRDCYSSFCTESELSCSTLEEEDSSYNATFTTDAESSSWEEDYYDEDEHYNLIQPPISSDQDSSADEMVMVSPQPKQHGGIDNVAEEHGKEKGEFCVQCHAWPDVEDCRDSPRRFFNKCYHTRIEPMECAFGTTVHLSTVSLSYVEESPLAVAKRKSVEEALRSQFLVLVQQFSVNPEKVARTLYGISVIDIVDLGVATAHTLSEVERATVLTVTLVRRLRKWPDLFGDVCKVLNDIPAMQEANAQVRRLLYEGCSEDEYSEILAKTVEQHRQTIEDRVPSTHGDEDSVASENTHELNPAGSDEDNNSHDIIVEDSVSYTSKMSEGADQEDVSSKKSDCACLNTKSGINSRLHESCLENRSTRSLDRLMDDGELDIDARDKNGRTPLIVACLCLPSETPNERISLKQRNKIKKLLVKGADSSIQDYDGNTALHIATLRRDQEVLKLLLDRSFLKEYFNVAITNKNSRTSLHYACFWGDMELVTPLLEFEKEAKSGLIGVRDRNGDTGLHIASRGGFKAAVKELLKANANKDILNRDGKTAAEVAQESKHSGIAKLIRRKKSRWLFPRKKSVSADQPDYGIRRTLSNSSLLSMESNLSDGGMYDDLSGEGSEMEEERDTEQ